MLNKVQKQHLVDVTNAKITEIKKRLKIISAAVDGDKFDEAAVESALLGISFLGDEIKNIAEFHHKEHIIDKVKKQMLDGGPDYDEYMSDLEAENERRFQEAQEQYEQEEADAYDELYGKGNW